MADPKEVERRTAAALFAIKEAHGTAEDEYGATLFVQHHLEEVEEAYWLEKTNSANPSPEQVISLLELRSHWGDEDDDGLDTFDFTLPDETTQYVICVRFDQTGEVSEITMES